MRLRWRRGCFAATLLLAAALTGSARAAGMASPFLTTAPRLFKVCEDQTYALCAVASCFVLNGVSYCRCNVRHGDSISLPFDFEHARDVCTVNAEGKNNGYMVSTFSLAPSVVAPEGNMALYDCPAATSTGAYAQCDGGVCFTSTRGQSFSGFAKPLQQNQIICSCPITVANPQTAFTGYQIAGPYPCQKSFFKNCTGAAASTDTGSQIFVGAPTGVARLLTRQLYGFVPPLNRCRPPLSP